MVQQVWLALGPGSSSQWPSRRWGDEAGRGTHGPVDQDFKGLGHEAVEGHLVLGMIVSIWEGSV